jgi:hypothetical protein
MKLVPCWCLLAVAGAGAAQAGDGKGSATIGAKNVVTFKVARTFVEGEPLATGSFTLPADWKFAGNSFESLEFEPAWAKYGRPSFSIAVRNDNLDPGEVAGQAKAEANAFKGKIAGGGKLVKTITDTKELALGAHLHGYLSSYEIDATAERHVHYVETLCSVWADGQKFFVTLQSSAEMADAKIVPDVEKACSTLALVGK